MSFPVASRKGDFQTVPRAFQANGPEGQVAALAVSTSAIAIDLTKGFSQAAFNGLTGANPQSLAQNCLTISSDVDIGIIFGPTLASVSGANAPVIATAGTLSGNTYVGAAGTCLVLKANSGLGSNPNPSRFLPQLGVDNFVGIVATGAGTVRMYQSSPSNA